MTINNYIAALPKAELHLHIEGTFEPELLFQIAERNQKPLAYDSVDALREAYQFNNLQEFLDIYYQGMNVLLTEQDFYDLTMAYFKRVKQDNVIHAEIFFDPQAHTKRGVAFETVIEGIHRAMVDAEKTLIISSRLILCFLRDESVESAELTLAQALPYKDWITAVGLDSAECGNPPSKFATVFAAAREAGFYTVAHAGEEGPSEYVQQALDQLKVSRIDHGNRSVDDEALVARLVQEQMPLTCCPLSNLKLRVVDDLAKNQLKPLYDAGVMVTINSDDPAYFGGYINENYKAIAEAQALSKEDLAAMARNSFKAAFLPEAQRQKYIAMVDQLSVKE